MVVYTDSAGMRYVGDCLYGNHSVGYPAVNYFKAISHDVFATDLADLLANSPLQSSYSAPLSQFDINTLTTKTVLVDFSSSGDNISNRYQFQVDRTIGTQFGIYPSPINLTGVVNIRLKDNLNATKAGLSALNQTATVNGSNGIGFVEQQSYFEQAQWTAATNGEFLAMYFTQKRLDINLSISGFFYAGLMDNVNPNFNYYDADIPTKSILIGGLKYSASSDNTLTDLCGVHYITSSNTYRKTLETGDAIYPIVCSDAQTPTGQWATDFYIFDNDVGLGYPAMGKVQGLLLAEGVFTMGKVVKIGGSVFPNTGYNSWLPVGTYAGKTVLMQCFSSSVAEEIFFI